MNIVRKFKIVSIMLMLIACNPNNAGKLNKYEIDPNFGDYWYQGKAELVSYDLEQVRYGEVRDGHAVFIFVTEDLSKSRQVKLDNPSENPSDAVKVMKLNATRKFTTGIYPYSTMSSVFTPVYFNDFPKTMKLTTSSQEWCGHTFLQANLAEDQYEIQGFSYFESEGDQQYSVGSVLMEDEVWNRIRLNPEQLPTGAFDMLPGSLYCRFKHIDFQPAHALASVKAGTDSTSIYQIQYQNLERTLEIEYETTFPYHIISWEESYPEGGEMMTTKASVKKTITLDYWNKNRKEDAQWREALGLDK